VTIKVIIAEDSDSTRKALKTVLKYHDCEIIGEAENGKQAVSLYKKLKPDVVLMDIAMPKMHGIDAIREIIKIDPKAKIIGITALYSPEKRKEVMDAGAVEIIVKPFDVPDLIEAIKKAIL
jgi:two-component system chemotaxis response regulator CheY